MAAGADPQLDCTATSCFLTLPCTMAWACNPYNQLLRISLRTYHIETLSRRRGTFHRACEAASLSGQVTIL